MKRYVLGIMLSSLPLMSCAFAQSAVQTPAFETLDTDGNGFISRNEASALPCLAGSYYHIERESEEGLNRSEFERAVQKFCGLRDRTPSGDRGGHGPNHR
jgi:hypothetical protein